MNKSIFNEGARSWYDGKGFIANPFNIIADENAFLSWNEGWWSVQNKMYETEKIELDKEFQLQMQKEREEKEAAEKRKTKKGRAELAGQYTLFG